jgi:hypothetical protein
MDTDASLPTLPCVGTPSSSRIQTPLPSDGVAVVNNIKIDIPPLSSVPPSLVGHSPHARPSSLQVDAPTLIQDMSTLQTHAYSRAGVIKPGTYSRSVSRISPVSNRDKLGCAGCNAVHSIGIDHCHKHDSDKNGKVPYNRLRR